MRRLLLLCAGLWVFSGAAQAQQFVAPEEMNHAGKTYRLAFQRSNPNDRALFEYTTDNEAVEHWTTLVTLIYKKSLNATPMKWLEMYKAALDRETPVPDYRLYIQGGNAYSIEIYAPDAKNPLYEANLQKSFHLEACGGLVTMQFARHYPPAPDQSETGKRAYLKQIAEDSLRAAAELQKSDWLPSCH